MREIKFRGFDGMEWIYGSAVLYVKETDTWYMIENGSPDDDWLMVCHVGQYTGLKDSKGQEIYEGDILLNNDGVKGSVFFEEGLCAYAVEFPNYNMLLMDYKAEHFDTMEILGDIYEID
jgi:hypothetical protein